MRSKLIVLAGVALATLAARPARATFHEMQIQQVIAGVNGTTSVQAIQLRMRALGQNLVSNGSLIVYDATGSNPVVVMAFPTNVTNSSAGSKVLAATAGFVNATSPALTPDFILTNPIPDSYLAAGSLTWEDNTGGVLWRLSWGGASYTGSGLGGITNDADGNFDPPFAGPLPSSTAQALLYQGVTTSLSTNNAADYALTTGAATFTNNAGATGTINNLLGVGDGPRSVSVELSPPAPNPVRNSLVYSVSLPREGRVQVRILDVGGRVVRVLVDETMAAGRHSLTWDASARAGSSLPNGIYFLDLSAVGTRKTERFVLMH